MRYYRIEEVFIKKLGQRTILAAKSKIDKDGYIIHPNGTRRKPFVSSCECCGKIVYYESGAKSGWYCDPLCFTKHNGYHVICDHCGKDIIRRKSKQSKLNFCNRKCKELEQRTGGKIQLSHYGTGVSNYRIRALSHYENKCIDCGETIIHRLAAHHKDHNRDNNDIGNLEILCHNHHSDRHKKISRNSSVGRASR